VAKTLAWFWLRRFLLVLGVAFVGLSVAELVQHGMSYRGLWSVAGWSCAAAVLAATFSTYWAYRIQCRMVFEDEAQKQTPESKR
jgi:hypothetical protein